MLNSTAGHTQISINAQRNELVEHIRRGLIEDGYFVNRMSIPEPEFMAICRELGTPWHRTSIKVLPESNLKALTGASMAFHTDNPYANVIAWHCKVSCEANTPTCVVNLRHVIAGFSDELRSLLSEIPMPIPTWDGSRFDPEALLSFPNGHIRINYIPWVKTTFVSWRHSAAFEAFREAVAEASKTKVLVSLNKGESLFINNNEVVHGRTQIPTGSNRELTRIWINCFGDEYVMTDGVCTM